MAVHAAGNRLWHLQLSANTDALLSVCAAHAAEVSKFATSWQSSKLCSGARNAMFAMIFVMHAGECMASPTTLCYHVVAITCTKKGCHFLSHLQS